MSRKLRAIVLEDDQSIRRLVKHILESYGFETLAYEDPASCPLSLPHDCQCQDSTVCADILISDVEMPHMTGLEFIEGQIHKGCKFRNIAFMSGGWSEADLNKARSLGCKTFYKPFDISELTSWIEECEASVEKDRILSDWFCGPDDSD